MPESSISAVAIDYDIVYVRQPRYGDKIDTVWPEVFHPAQLEKGADLMLLHPDGSEEILVEGGNGSVTDPFVSFDGNWVYYSYFYDLRPDALNKERRYLPKSGADIFRINIETHEKQQLTNGEFTPNTGTGNWDITNPLDPGDAYNSLGYGILNLGPCPLAGGKIAFVSNRNGFIPTKRNTTPNLQLFVMDEDGSNVTCISPMTLGSTLHPTPLQDGRIMFSSYESQGLRDERLWAIWSMYPDGRYWNPVVSAFRYRQAFHFMTQLSDQSLVVVDYYNENNKGFGALYRFPVIPPPGKAPFFSAFLKDNPDIIQTTVDGIREPFRMGFTPRGMVSITPFTHGEDTAAPLGIDGKNRVGKFTHPSAAPGNDMLIVWSAGPVNTFTENPFKLPYVNSGIYLIPDGNRINSPDDLIVIKNDPQYNEAWPRAVVSYSNIYGITEPVQLPWLPNNGKLHSELSQGTPYGLVGTSSFYKRESFPGSVDEFDNTFDGLDAFNTFKNEQSSNWLWQGADVGKYTNDDIWAVRLVAQEPNPDKGYGPGSGQQFFSHHNEKNRILGEIPLYKYDLKGNIISDAEGNPDTSYLVKIPADTAFTFQAIDRNGMALNISQTWHQLRPGEMRADCGGCHAHSSVLLLFEKTVAAKEDYKVVDLGRSTPLLAINNTGNTVLEVKETGTVNVEFLRDIRPILERSCTSCHNSTNTNPPAELVLDDHRLYSTLPGNPALPGDYCRLANDQYAKWGLPPLIYDPEERWRLSNASRYIRKFQSRRSLLIWKLYGKRLDGWTNGDHPTETVPGNVSTLTGGEHEIMADLDFTGTIMPPPDSRQIPLSEYEKMVFVRWIDMGCPISVTENGFFLDEQRPTLTVSSPKAGLNKEPLKVIRIGVADSYTGLDMNSFSITASFDVDGRKPGDELVGLAHKRGDDVFEIDLSSAHQTLSHGTVHVEIKDNQGNLSSINRIFTQQYNLTKDN